MRNRFEWRSHAPQISASLADLLDSMVASRVVDRPASAQDILVRLEQIASQPPSFSINLPRTTPTTTLPSTANKTASERQATVVQAGITTPSWQALPQAMMGKPPQKRWYPWQWLL